MKLPFTAWQLFVESIGALAFLVSVLSAWWGYTGDRRQAERTAGIQEQARISAKLDEHYMMLVNEKETDLRLEQTIERLSKSVEELRSQFGRLNAQVHQFESESQLRKRLEHLENWAKKHLLIRR
ncbi:MAG: hypothetical protein HC815_19520 [Richelia sp. RM1_1_1]|nr:hypothetical protein [Richelia sp. RM1_1_1]